MTNIFLKHEKFLVKDTSISYPSFHGYLLVNFNFAGLPGQMLHTNTDGRFKGGWIR